MLLAKDSRSTKLHENLFTSDSFGLEQSTWEVWSSSLYYVYRKLESFFIMFNTIKEACLDDLIAPFSNLLHFEVKYRKSNYFCKV